MNAATAFATVLVDELVRQGMRYAVICPGSRSTPVALALARAHDDGRIHVRVHFDERSAGFLALGLAKVSGAPTAVLTTSGTAAANLLPAVIEASHAAVPLLALTADRPPELRGVGANQTIDQVGLFGAFVRHFVDLEVPEDRPGNHDYWRSTTARAVTVATGMGGSSVGPVHLNLPLRVPLLPEESTNWHEDLSGRPGQQPWVEVAQPASEAAVARFNERTLVLVGDTSPNLGRAAIRLAEEQGWPVISEPSGNAALGPNAISTGGWLLDVAEVWQRLKPAEILVVGRPTLSRAVQRAIADDGIIVSVITEQHQWADANHNVSRVFTSMPSVEPRSQRELGWLEEWRAIENATRRVVDAMLDAHPGAEQTMVRDLHESLPADSLLVAGSSLPIRHLFLCSRVAEGVTTIANRGAAGIDGTISCAVGAAHAWQLGGGGPAIALVGDLTLLHDSNGLAVPESERPDLAIVVINNDGGGIFELLEPAEVLPRATFERNFVTPHGTDFAALAGAHRVPYSRVSTGKDVAAAALDPRTDMQVIEVRTDRRETAALHTKLRQAVKGGALLDGETPRGAHSLKKDEKKEFVHGSDEPE